MSKKQEPHRKGLAGALKAERAKGGGGVGDIGHQGHGFRNQRATYNSDNELWTATEVAVSKAFRTYWPFLRPIPNSTDTSSPT